MEHIRSELQSTSKFNDVLINYFANLQTIIHYIVVLMSLKFKICPNREEMKIITRKPVYLEQYSRSVGI